MRCWVNPDKLASLGITVPEITNAIQTQNTVNPAGQIGSEPVPSGQDFTYTVRAPGRLPSAEEFGQIIVRAQPDGGILRLKDVARIELGAQTYALQGRLNGKPAALLAIYQLPGTNAVKTAQGVRKLMAGSEDTLPAGARLCHSTGYDAGSHGRPEGDKDTRCLKRSGWSFWWCLSSCRVGAPLSFRCWQFRFHSSAHSSCFRCLGFLSTRSRCSDLVLAIGLGGRRRHCGGGGRRASHRAWNDAERGDSQGHGRSVRPGSRHCADPVSSIHTYGVHSWNHRDGCISNLRSPSRSRSSISAFNALTLSPALSAMLLKPRKQGRGPLAIFFRWFNKVFGRATDGYVTACDHLIRKVRIRFSSSADCYAGGRMVRQEDSDQLPSR